MSNKREENLTNEVEDFEEPIGTEEDLEKETKPKPKKFGRVKVNVVRAYLYVHADPLSRTIEALSFGNLLLLLEAPDYSTKFFKVKVPRRDGKSLEGFVLKTKTKKV
jgi:hypothetical protein